MTAQNRGDLTDEQWSKIKLLLPAQKPRTGRPNNRPLAKVSTAIE